MGAVEVLRPQDPLNNRLKFRDTTFVNSAKQRNYNSNPKPSRGSGKSDLRKRISPQKNGCSTAAGSGGAGSPPEAKGNLVVAGPVRILKRGEALSDTASLRADLETIGDSDRVEKELVGRPGPGPGPATEPVKTPKKFNMGDFYAGSACDNSPPPSSLPVPAFFKKKNMNVENNDFATSYLRSVLRLEIC